MRDVRPMMQIQTTQLGEFCKPLGWKITGTVVIQKGNQVLSIEVIEVIRPFLLDRIIAKSLTYDGCIFAFSQGIIVAMPGPRLGSFDLQFIEELYDVMIDIFRAIVRVKTFNLKGEQQEHFFP